MFSFKANKPKAQRSKTRMIIRQIHILTLWAFPIHLQNLLQNRALAGLNKLLGWAADPWVKRGWSWLTNSILFLKLLNSSGTNFGPFSLIRCSASSFLANKVLSISTLCVAVVRFIFNTSGYLEWTFTTIRNIDLKNGPAKSTWFLCHGLTGNSQRWISASGTVLHNV